MRIDKDVANAASDHLSASDDILASVIRTVGPCTLRSRGRHYFDTLASSIIGQQLSAKAAGTIRARVCKVVGQERPFRPGDFLECNAAALRRAGLSTGKARYIQNLAHAVVQGSVSFREYHALEEETVIDALTQLPGIGRWTAEMFLIFALGRPDVFAEADAGLRRAANNLYGKGRKLSDSKLRRISEPWRPYRSIASWYLWRSLD